MSIQFYTSKAYEAFQGTLPTLIPAAKSGAKWGSVVAITLFALNLLAGMQKKKEGEVTPLQENGKKPMPMEMILGLGTGTAVGRAVFCLASSEGKFLMPMLYSLANGFLSVGIVRIAKDDGMATASQIALKCVVLNAACIAAYNRTTIINFFRSGL